MIYFLSHTKLPKLLPKPANPAKLAFTRGKVRASARFPHVKNEYTRKTKAVKRIPVSLPRHVVVTCMGDLGQGKGNKKKHQGGKNLLQDLCAGATKNISLSLQIISVPSTILSMCGSHSDPNDDL